MADGQVVFEISGDNRPIEQSLRETTRAIERESRNWDSSTREASGNMENSMTSMFKKVAASAAAAKIGQFLLNIGKEAVSLASDLQEVQNVVDVTFGESASAIQSWADKAKTQFGLTELQAKRFTSTLGAMMKSAGLAGPEIVDMSTSLAGLAADMASFYNLDFETAFQKIRAGISGETEPLKQLGVNMSVANLEAYAMTQGITKAFDKMSQSEQVQLRYQYLMQATADAQGDFARTSSDSFANMQRNIETNLTSIKSSLGNLLIGPVQEATGVISNFLSELTKPAERTILDDFAGIEIDKKNKIQDIQAIALEAQLLIDQLDKINETSAGTAMEKIAAGANALNSSSPKTWSELLGSLQKIDGLQNVFSGNGAGNVESLAQALSGSSPDVSKAEAWQTFLDALNVNPDALAALTGKSAEETAEWLKTIGDAAQNIDPEDAAAWDKLLSNFVSGLPGFKDTDAGKAFFASITSELLAMGSESEEAESRLAALGMSTDDIDNAQKKWLETCKRLVQLIPGLSEIINTQTGEVKGGTQAIEDYVKAWSDNAILQARINALKAQKALLETQLNIDYATERDLAMAKAIAQLQAREGMTQEEAKAYVSRYAAARSTQRNIESAANKANNSVERIGLSLFAKAAPNATKQKDVGKEATEALDAYVEAEKKFRINQQTLPIAIQTVNDEIGKLEKEYGKTEEELLGVSDATDQATESLSLLARAAGDDADAMNKVKNALENAQEAFKNLADYQEKVRQETAQSVAQVIKGFESMGQKGADGLWAWNTPAEEASRKMKDLSEQMNKLNTNTKEGKKQWEALNAQMNQLGGQKASVQNMAQSLKSQLAYIQEYKKMMDEARRLGVSEEILASLSDGSQQSFDYLKALTTTGGNITGEGGLNDLYRQVQEESAGFVDELTKQKLAADETYQGLVATAQQAVASLNLGETAYNSVAATVDGIVKALGDKKTEVQSQVDGILFQISRLGLASGYGTNFNRNGMLYFSAPKPKGSQANGLDYVPYDGLFMLHQGERVETAAENELSRHYSNRAPGFDYNAVGSAVGANMPNMGNMQIVWRGRVVADVLSGMQADSYRALERSGWKQ